MTSKAEQLYQALHSELNGELLQTQALLTEARQRIDELIVLKDENHRLLDYNRACQDTINSLTSQAEHWKRESEKNAHLKTQWFDRARFAEGRLSEIKELMQDISPDGGVDQQGELTFTPEKLSPEGQVNPLMMGVGNE